MEQIKTRNGLIIDAKYLRTVSDGVESSKIFYAQDRLVECDMNNMEIRSIDVFYILGMTW